MLICLLALTACNKAMWEAQAPDAPIEYPPSWPIAELTVPPGTVQVPIGHLVFEDAKVNEFYVDGYVDGAGTAYERHSWRIAFQGQITLDEVHAHLAECLKPHNFQRWLRQGELMGFVSADKRQRIEVEALGVGEGGMSWRLNVFFWRDPRPDVKDTAPL